MYEFEEFEYEFSKIYKRLLRLELLLKKKIKECALSTYGDEVMEKFEKFFNNPKIYSKYKNDSENRNSIFFYKQKELNRYISLFIFITKSYKY